MPHTLHFDVLHRYALEETGISVPLRLTVGRKSIDVWSKLDTGASVCIFAREYAEALDLLVEEGLPARIRTATGGLFRAFGHTVSLDVLGISFESTVYFAAVPDFPRNVLGRQGWLNRVRLGLVDYEGRLYLNADRL